MQQHCPAHGASCSTIIHQTLDVGLPITLSPSINVGDIKLLCCGDPYVECCSACADGGGFSLKITQTVTYEIPISYRIEASAGDVRSTCTKPTARADCAPFH